MQPPQSKNDMQKFLDKLNYSTCRGKISSFDAILRLKNEADFTWGGGQGEGKNNNLLLIRSKSTCLHHR
jgi:hypothetical protein